APTPIATAAPSVPAAPSAPAPAPPPTPPAPPPAAAAVVPAAAPPAAAPPAAAPPAAAPPAPAPPTAAPPARRPPSGAPGAGRAVCEAEESLARGAADKAVVAASKVVREHPESLTARALLDRARRELLRGRRRERLEARVLQAQQQLEAGDFEAAGRIVTSAL